MTETEKILMCIEHCRQENIKSDGLVLEGITEEDFKNMKIIVETMLEEF